MHDKAPGRIPARASWMVRSPSEPEERFALVGESYKLLSAALQLGEFTVASLAHRARVQRSTADSWLRRNVDLVTRVRQVTTARRGRTSILWRLKRDAHEQGLQQLEDLWRGSLARSTANPELEAVPDLDSIKELNKATKLIDDAITVADRANRAFAGRSGVGEPVHAATTDDVSNLKVVAEQWLGIAESIIGEWRAADHHPSEHTKSMLRAAAAALRDPRTFALRLSFRQFIASGAEEKTIFDISDWISGLIGEICRVDNPNPETNPAVNPLEHEIFLNMCATRILHAVTGENRIRDILDRFYLACVVALSRPALIATANNSRSAASLVVLMRLITRIGSQVIGRALGRALSQPGLFLAREDNQIADIFAHLLASVTAQPQFRSDSNFDAWMWHLRQSRHWNPAFAPLLFHAASKNRGIDLLRLQNELRQDIAEFDEAVCGAKISLDSRFFRPGLRLSQNLRLERTRKLLEWRAPALTLTAIDGASKIGRLTMELATFQANADRLFALNGVEQQR